MKSSGARCGELRMENKEKDYTRKFSLEEDFMNLNSDDLILGYIHYLATFIEQKKILYITEKKITAERAAMATIIDRTPQTVKNKINKMIEKGLLIKDQLEINGQKEPVFIIPQLTKGKYEIIHKDIMWHIICTRKRFILKIYIYLLNKYDWKKEVRGDPYSFTAGELAEAIGYSKGSAVTGSITSIINTALTSLKFEGVIDYIDYFDGKSPRKRLIFVAHDMKELTEKNKAKDIPTLGGIS